MRKTSLLAVVLASLLSLDLSADQVILQNGDRLTGTVLRLEAARLTLKSELAGEVTLPWAAVETISSTEPLYVTLADGQVILGTLATSEARIQIRTQEGETVTVSRDAIQAIHSREEQAAYEAELQRRRHPRLLDFWGGSLSAGLSSARGNADTFSFNLAVKTARTTERDRISLYLHSLFARNSTLGTAVTTADAIRGGTRYNINLTDRLFTFGFTDLEFDEFQQLDLRLVLGGGMGWHARKTSRTLLQLFAGGSSNQEFFSTGLTRRSGELLWGEDLSYKLSGRTSLTERLAFYPNVTETGEYRVTFDASAVTKLSNRLNWHITLSDRFFSNPVPGTQKNDVLLTTGISFSFGSTELRGQATSSSERVRGRPQ
ncbi:MAG: YdiY family protein [Terriglobia bacterium]